MVDEILHEQVVEGAFELGTAVRGHFCASTKRAEHLVTEHGSGLCGCFGWDCCDDEMFGEMLDAEHDVGVAVRGGDERACEVATPSVE